MPVPLRLNRKLQQTLGPEAAEDLMNLLDGVELQRSELRAFREGMRADFAEFRLEMQGQIAELRADTRQQIAELRADTHQHIAALRADTQQQIAEVRADTQLQITEFRESTNQQFAALGTSLERVRADLLKWSFLFWCAAVGSIAGLAGILR